MSNARKPTPRPLTGGAFAVSKSGGLDQVEDTTKPPVPKSIAKAEAAAAAAAERRPSRAGARTTAETPAGDANAS